MIDGLSIDTFNSEIWMVKEKKLLHLTQFI